MGCRVNAVIFLLLIVSSTLLSATRDMGSGIFNSVKEMYDSVKEKEHDLRSVYKNSYSYGSSAVNLYLQDDKARSDLASSIVFTILMELAKGFPGGVPAYNIISETFHGNKIPQDNQDYSEVTKLISEVAKIVGLYAIEKGAHSVPGGAPVYKLLSQLVESQHENEKTKDRGRELSQLHARIDKLEREFARCECDPRP